MFTFALPLFLPTIKLFVSLYILKDASSNTKVAVMSEGGQGERREMHFVGFVCQPFGLRD